MRVPVAAVVGAVNAGGIFDLFSEHTLSSVYSIGQYAAKLREILRNALNL